MLKTLAYDILKLHSPGKLTASWGEGNLPDFSNIPVPQTVTVPKSRYIEWSNDFKIMGELIGVLVGNDNWNNYDLLRFYNKLEAKICPCCDKPLDGTESIFRVLKRIWTIIEKGKTK